MDEFKIKLMTDIEKTGFPLEMEISQIIKGIGWKVQNSSYYIDRDENKGREIDIIASIHRSQEIYKGIHLEVVFSLVMEVKKTEDKPWVIFTSETDSVIERLLPKNYVFSSFTCEGFKINRLLRKNTESANPRSGRNFYQGFTKNGGRDDIYKALTGTHKAMHHKLENCSAYSNKSEDRLFHFVEPVILIQGKLFEAYINENNEMQLEEAKYVQTYFNYLSPNYPSESTSNTVVHVINKDYLEQFIHERNESLNSFFEDLISNEIF